MEPACEAVRVVVEAALGLEEVECEAVRVVSGQSKGEEPAYS